MFRVVSNICVSLTNRTLAHWLINLGIGTERLASEFHPRIAISNDGSWPNGDIPATVTIHVLGIRPGPGESKAASQFPLLAALLITTSVNQTEWVFFIFRKST